MRPTAFSRTCYLLLLIRVLLIVTILATVLYIEFLGQVVEDIHILGDNLGNIGVLNY
jgi:hypothetical protein